MTFAMLSSAHAEDRGRWLALWEASIERDPFAHPSYAALFAGEEDEALCATWTTPTGGILFPLIARPLRSLEWASSSEDRDATTPYGYGGPVRWGQVDGGAFFAELLEWFRDHSIVSAFTRLSLFPEWAATPPQPWTTKVVAQNVIRSLDLEPEDLWRDYAHKVRKNVKRARSHELRCTADETGAHLGAFLDVYESTMKRREARDSYFFDRAFFETIAGLTGSFVFFHVWQNDTLISTELVLRSRSALYSYLGGTRAEAFNLRPNDLLKHEVCTWGGENGLRAFVLGGGYTRDDGIFKYKKAFAPNGVVDFSTSSVLALPDDVARLVSMRRAADTLGTWEPREDFFPPYRAD